MSLDFFFSVVIWLVGFSDCGFKLISVITEIFSADNGIPCIMFSVSLSRNYEETAYRIVVLYSVYDKCE